MIRFDSEDIVFAQLSDDVIIHMCGFLTIQGLGCFSCCSRSSYICCNQEELWVTALQHLFPASTSFITKSTNLSKSSREHSRESGINSSYPAAASKYKIRNFVKKRFHVSSVGNLEKFRSRFLHRCVTNQCGTNFIFGGVSTSTNTNFGSFSDVWKIVVDETDQEIIFSRVPIISRMNDHVPSNSSAGGMCVISTGDILLFGGIIDTVFSSQFWLLRLTYRNSSGSATNKKSNGSSTATTSEALTLTGEWEDIRMRSLLSDEQIAVNEHMALVMANNNQIMMEVNNQYNSDDDDEGIIPDSQPRYIDERGTVVPYEGSPCTRKRGEMPPGRWGHTVLYYEHFVFLYGGSRPGTSYGDIWVASEEELLRGNFDCWSEQIVGRAGLQTLDFRTGLPIPNAPEPRGGHAATVVGDYMYVFGGNDVNRTFSDLWKISLKDIVDCARRQWYIENQENNNKDESDYRYNFSEDIVTSSPRWPYKYPRWQCICRSSHLVGGPSPLIGHCATTIGRKILVFGGRDIHKSSFGSGIYFFDTISSLWEDVRSSINAPSIFLKCKNTVTEESHTETDIGEEINDTDSHWSDDSQNSDELLEDIELRTGQCAIPCSSGVLYIGGLCKSGNSSSEILHLNLFGMYGPLDFIEKDKLSLIPLTSVSQANSSLSPQGDESYSTVTVTAASYGSKPVLPDAFQKWSSLSTDSLGNLTARRRSATHDSISQKKSNIQNLEALSGCRSYQIIEDV